MTLVALDEWYESDRKSIREQIDRIARSEAFAGSPRRQRFLEYIVQETLAGRGSRLKGYSVALEVFGRPDTFDANTDPIVRIEAGRLRDKLRIYYETEGRSDSIYIELPCGSYKPRITFRNSINGFARFAESGTRDVEAHDAWQKGLSRFWDYTREACGEAQVHFAEAIAIDPGYATAHAWLARTYVWQACMNWTSPSSDAIEPALEHARRAVETDPRSYLGHSILGKVRLYLKDGQSAVTEAERACALEPNAAEAKMFLSFNLAAAGHGEEALRLIQTAMLLQPHPSSYFYETLGLSFFAIGAYNRAIAEFRRGIGINPSYMPCHYELAVVYGVRGCIEEARAEAAIVQADCPSVSVDCILDGSFGTIYRRGKEAAGLA
jgi:Tfp pilus assembly protein PilF